MRNGVISLPPLPGGTAPAPPSCGLKNREVTLEKTNRALNPWKLGTLTRPAMAGILELCHSIGKVSGVLPNTPKSYAYGYISRRTHRRRLNSVPTLVEGGFQYSRIRSTKYRVRLLHVVSDADTGLGFLVRSQAVVQITAQTQIYGPVSLCDRVLHVQG